MAGATITYRYRKAAHAAPAKNKIKHSRIVFRQHDIALRVVLPTSSGIPIRPSPSGATCASSIPMQEGDKRLGGDSGDEPGEGT